MRRILLIAAVLVLAPAALAQGKPGGAENVKYERKTVINFEDDTIEGDLTKPDGEYVEARKRVRHSNLIKIREQFREKVLQSVGEL